MKSQNDDDEEDDAVELEDESEDCPFAKAFGPELIDYRLNDGEKVLLLWLRFINTELDIKEYTKTQIATDLGVTIRCIEKRLNTLSNLGYLESYCGTWLTSNLTGQIYFIQSINGGPIKIGKAIDIQKRLISLQTDHHTELRLLVSIPDGGTVLEHELHNKFDKYLIRGEWFEPSDELLEYIDILKNEASSLPTCEIDAGQ